LTIITSPKYVVRITVKLRYNGTLGTTLKGLLYLKSVISKSALCSGPWNVCSA